MSRVKKFSPQSSPCLALRLLFLTEVNVALTSAATAGVRQSLAKPLGQGSTDVGQTLQRCMNRMQGPMDKRYK